MLQLWKCQGERAGCSSVLGGPSAPSSSSPGNAEGELGPCSSMPAALRMQRPGLWHRVLLGGALLGFDKREPGIIPGKPRVPT